MSEVETLQANIAGLIERFPEERRPQGASVRTGHFFVKLAKHAEQKNRLPHLLRFALSVGNTNDFSAHHFVQRFGEVLANEWVVFNQKESERAVPSRSAN